MGQSTQELYFIWIEFSDSPKAVEKLAAYLNGDQQKAQRLINDFEIRREAEHLGYEERGMHGRQRRHF